MRRREAREEAERARLAARPHRVLMRFQRSSMGWQVRFTPVDSDWVLRVCTFADEDKIRSMWRRFAAAKMLEDVQAFDRGLEQGRGAAELRLGDEQYAALRRLRGRT